MTDIEILNFLMSWYSNNCNGSWEHQHGVMLDTVDNPGWRLEISLAGTHLERKLFEEIKIDNSDNDWLFCKVENGQFKATGDPSKLREMLLLFIRFAT